MANSYHFNLLMGEIYFVSGQFGRFDISALQQHLTHQQNLSGVSVSFCLFLSVSVSFSCRLFDYVRSDEVLGCFWDIGTSDRASITSAPRFVFCVVFGTALATIAYTSSLDAAIAFTCGAMLMAVFSFQWRRIWRWRHG